MDGRALAWGHGSALLKIFIRYSFRAFVTRAKPSHDHRLHELELYPDGSPATA